MTQLLQKAIDRLKTLPDERQDMLAQRILARVEEEQRREAELLADLDEGIAQLDAGQVSEWDKEAFLKEVKRRKAGR
jgi:hypothetical protein